MRSMRKIVEQSGSLQGGNATWQESWENAGAFISSNVNGRGQRNWTAHPHLELLYDGHGELCSLPRLRLARYVRFLVRNGRDAQDVCSMKCKFGNELLDWSIQGKELDDQRHKNEGRATGDIISSWVSHFGVVYKIR